MTFDFFTGLDVLDLIILGALVWGVLSYLGDRR